MNAQHEAHPVESEFAGLIPCGDRARYSGTGVYKYRNELQLRT